MRERFCFSKTVTRLLVSLVAVLMCITLIPGKVYAAEDTFKMGNANYPDGISDFIQTEYNAGSVTMEKDEAGNTVFTMKPFVQTIYYVLKINYVFDRLEIDDVIVDATKNADGSGTYTFVPSGTPKEHSVVAYFSPKFEVNDAYSLRVSAVSGVKGSTSTPITLTGDQKNILTIDPENPVDYYDFTYEASLNLKQTLDSNFVVSTIYNKYATDKRFRSGVFTMNITSDGSQIAYDDWTNASSTHMTFNSPLFIEDVSKRTLVGNTYSGSGNAADGSFKPTSEFTVENSEVTVKLQLKVPYKTIVSKLMDGDATNDTIIAESSKIESAIKSNSSALFGWYDWTKSAPILINLNANITNTKITLASSKDLKSVLYHPNHSNGNDYLDDNQGMGYIDTDTPSVITAKTAGYNGLSLTLADDFEYVLDSWNTKADNSGTSYQPGDTIKFSDFTGTPELYAQWKVQAKEVTKLPADGLIKLSSGSVFDTEHLEVFKVKNGDTVDLKATMNAYKIYSQLLSLDATAGDKAASIKIEEFTAPFTYKLTIPKGVELPSDYKDQIEMSMKNDMYVLGDKSLITYENNVLTIPFKFNRDYAGKMFTELKNDLAAETEGNILPISVVIKNMKVSSSATGNLTFEGTVTGGMDAKVSYKGTTVMKLSIPYEATQEDPDTKSDAVYPEDPSRIRVTISAPKKAVDTGNSAGPWIAVGLLVVTVCGLLVALIINNRGNKKITEGRKKE